MNEKRNIGALLAEHKAASLLRTVSDRSSLFYLSYPSKQSKVPSGELQRGYYSDLRFSVGLSFDRSDADAIRALCASAGEGEVFLWPSNTLAKLGKLKLAGCLTIENKQLHVRYCRIEYSSAHEN